jgi:hypothetical protein
MRAGVVLAAMLAVGCKSSGPAQVDHADRAPTKDPAKDTVRSEDAAPAPPDVAAADKDTPVNQAPPTPNTPPPEDTTRYVAWMSQQGKPVKDTPSEAVNLRIGDWGFFDHGPGPGAALDRTGLDKASHAIQPQEQGHWHAFLTTPGLDAAGALKRVAWLFRALDVGPSPKTPKVTVPTLEVAKDGSVKLQGWIAFPPNMGAPMRMTITATPTGAKLVNESADKL